STGEVYSGAAQAYPNADTDYIAFKEMISNLTNATDQAQPFIGSYSFSVTSAQQITELLAIGIPASCQLSLYGMVRQTEEGRYVNTVTTTACPVTLGANNEQIILSAVTGSAARNIYGVSLGDIVIPEPLQVVLDYGKPIELPMNELWTRVKVKDKNIALSYVGLTQNGENGAIRGKEPANLFCNSSAKSKEVESGTFYLNNGTPTFKLKELMTHAETIYAVYRISLRDTQETIAYLMEEVELLPATMMYYETDFAEGIFTFTKGNYSTVDKNGSTVAPTEPNEVQDDGTVFPGDAFVKIGNEEKDYSHALFFDFSNNAVDRQRYQQSQYCGKNYDELDSWGIVHSLEPVTVKSMNNDAGTLSFQAQKDYPVDANRLDLHIAPGNISFDPTYAEVLQVRMKLDGFSYGASYSTGPFFRLWWWGSKDGNKYRGYENATYLGRDYVSDGTYVTYTVDLVTILDGQGYNSNGDFSGFMDMRSIDTIGELRFSLHNFSVTTESKVTYDYLYIGPKNSAPVQHGQNSLYFTFDGTDSEKLRYEYPQYGGTSPDKVTSGSGAVGSWKSGHYIDPVGTDPYTNPVTPTIDPVSGTISAQATAAVDEPNNLYFKLEGLDYPAKNTEIIEIRVRFDDIDIITSNASWHPRFQLWYGSDTGSSYISGTDGYLYQNQNFKLGEYITIRVTPDAEFLKRNRISFLNLAFHEFKTNLNSRITLDYVYLGPEADAPSKQESVYSSAKNDFLYFGFENDAEAQNRYGTSTYNGMNFDLLEGQEQLYWDVNDDRCRMPEIDHGNGTMTLVAEYDTSINENYDKGFYVQNGELNAAKQWLNYSPDRAEVAQVRVRLKGFKPVGSTTACIYLSSYRDGVYQVEQNGKPTDACKSITEKVPVDTRFLDSDRYITVSMPINEDVRTNAALLNNIRLNFESLTSISTQDYGTVTIDYIYVGPRDSAPEPVYGYDSSYEDDTALSNGSSLFAEGLGVKPAEQKDEDGNIIEYTGDYTRAYFQFTGTGFDVISRTGMDQAMIRVMVYTHPDLREENCIKTLTVNNKGELELYQIPVVSVQGLEHGTYYVSIDVHKRYNAPISILSRGGQFHFDAVRIYDPIDTTKASLTYGEMSDLIAHQMDKEDRSHVKEIRNILLSAVEFSQLTGVQAGAVFIDTYEKPTVPVVDPETGKPTTATPEDLNINNSHAMDILTYNKVGPKNEVYLDPDQAIAFKLQIDSARLPASLDIGAKTITGTRANLVAAIVSEDALKSDLLTIASRTEAELTSTTAMYYPLNLRADMMIKEGNARSCYIVIYNAPIKDNTAAGRGDCVLSITDVKLAYAVDPNAVVEDAPTDPEIPELPTTAPEEGAGEAAAVSFVADSKTTRAAAAVIRKELETPILTEGGKLLHTLDLASDITLNYAVPKTAMEGYDSFYLDCELFMYEGNEAKGSGMLCLYPEERGNYYYFTLKGLTAVQMNDEILATLRMEKDGRFYYWEADRYSIAQYAYGQLAKGGATPKLKALCAQLLRYGAAAQIFKGYRTDALADRLLTQEQRSYLTDLNSVTFGNTNVSGTQPEQPTVTWVGKSLDLNSRVAVKLVVDLSAYTGNREELQLRLTYRDHAGNTVTAVVDTLSPYGETGNRYAFTFSGLLAAELRTVLTAQVYQGDKPVSVSLQYSPDTYGNNKVGTLGTLCRALFAYSDSAKAFFAN
ncbi:MAG: hypothetical protein J6K89_01695, partial [Oscillospiraceae bacterium]|nr:hypothetical protein [Oscillospiraceae bacterium]